MSVFAQRVISGLLAAALLFATAAAGGWWFGAFALFVMGVCLYEFFGMSSPDDLLSRSSGVLAGLLLAAAILTGSASGDTGLFILTALVLVPAVFSVFRPQDLETVAARTALATLGVLWVGGLGALTTSLVLLESGYRWVCLAAFIAFGSDIGAYFAGKAFGKRKLHPKVSPAKTWEGAIGGVLSAVLLSVGWAQVVDLGLPTFAVAGLALVGAPLGQIGDLAESMMKRSVGVKDSGSIMPGHGGLLDRIDALLFIGPPLFLFARLGLEVPVHWLSMPSVGP